MNKVEFSHITLSYGTNVVVRDFSLSVKEGEIVGIVGPSGCGKTTLMRCLCGLKNPDSGEIFVGGTERQPVPSGDSSPHRRGT